MSSNSNTGSNSNSNTGSNSNSNTTNDDWIRQQPYHVDGKIPNIKWSPGHLKGDGKADPSFSGTEGSIALGLANRAVSRSSLLRLDKLILTRSVAKESVGGVQEQKP